ncbi:Pre-rRNA-processing protein TSR2-like [Holothuria leucospilota]|uniref:Pre-rRNA-processing protein TSR2 homolog n=1 Tax=Holothuria leucospilota TaxID=206669 RepID=A0A9Q1CN96_HOLLE|nr:Pre-rRNA-processing protein TSR2-like [Holothuria leucospilota]
MAAPLVSHDEIFRQSICSVFKSWTALQLAVENGCGGPYAREKADWMVDAVFNWFTENDGILPDELGDFIAELLNNEFDTIAEDGSVQQVSKRICLDFDTCKAGNAEAVIERIQKDSAANVKNSQADPSHEMQEDSQDSDMTTHNVQAMFGSVAIQNNEGTRQNNEDNTTRNEDHPEENDGWTVVRKPRKR